MEDAQQIQALILQKDGKFQRACAQVLLLNNMVQELQTRYDRAVAQNSRQYRYTLRLRLCTVEGLRNMYYEYACQSADEIEVLEDTMRQLGVEPMPIYGTAWKQAPFFYMQRLFSEPQILPKEQILNQTLLKHFVIASLFCYRFTLSILAE